MPNNILAVDIGGTFIKCALVSEDYEILEKCKFPTPYSGAEDLVAAICGGVAGWNGRFSRIGVCMPGTIHGDDDGTVYRGGSLTYMDQVPLGKMLREKMQVPCSVENDGKAAALGEYVKGALAGCRCGILMALGTGVGGGIVLDGKVWRGCHSFAGEFSYIYSDPAKAPDVESLFGLTGGAGGLRECVLVSKSLPPDTELSGEEIFAAANVGDQDALNGIRAYTAIIARQICGLQAILDPDTIAIGGGISAQPLLIKLIRAELEALYAVLPEGLSPPRARVVAAQRGNDANLLGAAYSCRAG